jgi:hypothetical protein
MPFGIWNFVQRWTQGHISDTVELKVYGMSADYHVLSICPSMNCAQMHNTDIILYILQLLLAPAEKYNM